jgi:hypothetical protein
MNQNIIDDLKAFDWQTIIEYGNSLDDLNQGQWRFLKGLVCEFITEKCSNGNLIYVGQNHKDFDWPRHNISISVELKSQLSSSMYTEKGRLRKNYPIKLNNSHGTNKKKKMDIADVADLIIIVRDDGAFAIDQATAIRNAISGGDGFEVKVPKNEIVELSGLIVPDKVYNTNLKQQIMTVIRDSLP